MRRRQLLRNLAVTAAASVAPAGLSSHANAASAPGDLLVANLRDALLVPRSTTQALSAEQVRTGVVSAMRAFQACRYEQLAVDLPRLLVGGHALADSGGPAEHARLAEVYTLATRMLIKLDATELGLIAADRCRLVAAGADDPIAAAEAARNLSVLTRKAGWHDQATDIALNAAAASGLKGGGPRVTAQRGLLVMSAAYTAAKAQDRVGMRELTGQAMSIANGLGDRVVLPSHGGGFGVPVVDLHLISGFNACRDPRAALAVARKVNVAALLSVERRSRFWSDVAASHALLGRRSDCLDALLAAERLAPQETHARPATRALIKGLLTSGRLTPEIRELAARSAIT